MGNFSKCTNELNNMISNCGFEIRRIDLEIAKLEAKRECINDHKLSLEILKDTYDECFESEE